MQLDDECTSQGDAEWGLVRTTTREQPTTKDYIYNLGECFKFDDGVEAYITFVFTCTDGSGEGVDAYIIDT